MKRKLLYCLLLLLSATFLHAQITVYPNITDFQSEGLCGTSCTTPCNLTGTWRNGDQWGFPQAGTDWLVEDGSTPSASTGPDIDHTLGNATGKYAYTETSGCTNTSAHLVSNYFSFAALSAPKLRFWYHMFGATMGTMHVDVDTSGLGNWVLNVTPAWTGNVNVWQEKTVDLSAFAGLDSVRLRIRATTGTSFTSDMAVDDIEVYEPAPFDLNVLSVAAGGGCGNSATTPVSLSYFNAGTDSLMIGDTLLASFMIGGNTVTDTVILGSAVAPGDTVTYTFVGGFADLSGPGSVTINAWTNLAGDSNSGNDSTSIVTYGIPVIATYPYFEDFELGQNGWVINNTTNGTWAFGTPAKTVINSAASGVNAFVTGGLTGTYLDNENSYVQGPCFDLTNVCDPIISAKIWWNAEFSWDGMNITASTDGGTTWGLVGNMGDAINWYNDNSINGNPGGFQSGWTGRNSTTNGSGGWVTVTHRLTGFGGYPNVKIRFNFGTDGSVVDDGVAFDDVRISNGPWIGNDQIVCAPATVNLDANVGGATDTYLWNTGATTSGIIVSSTGWYSVATTGAACTTSDSVYIVVQDSLTAVNLGGDTTGCDSYTLDAGYWPGASILWSNGATTRSIQATTGGNYSVSVVTPCDTLTDDINLIIGTSPVVELGVDTAACGSLLLDAGNNASSYSWSTGATGSSISATLSGTYSVTAMDSSGCSATDSIMVQINPNPTVSLGNDQVLCDGAILTLDAGNSGLSYLWSDNSTNQTLPVSTAGTYSVVVSDTLGCSGSDTIAITTANSPVAGFTFSVAGAGLDYSFTSTGSGANTYAWDFGDGNSSTTQDPQHTFAAGNYMVTLIVSNDCGNDTISQSVTVVGLAQELANGSLNVFPNPNNGDFRVSFDLSLTDDVQLSVSNLAGQVVFRKDMGTVNGHAETQISLQELPAGMYFVRILGSNGQAVRMMHVE